MNDYGRVAKRLNTVRRAWKRTAALSGLAVVILESSGIFTVALLIDVLYTPRPPVRVGIFALAAAALAYLVARHIIAPLFRRIPDQQLALYVEEHDSRFEGALIAAAEFHTPLPEVSGSLPKVSHLREGMPRNLEPGAAEYPPEGMKPSGGKSPEGVNPSGGSSETDLVDAIIASAAARAERIDLRKVIDLSRFRKYGVAAVAVLVAYFAAGIGLPSAVGHHAARVLRPWQPTQEDRPVVESGPEAKPPIVFTLSRQDSGLLRGTPFDLEVTLSRAAEAPVLLHFRSLADEKGQTRWRHLAMTEIEKLNGYRIVIPDVNEDMEFFVAAAEDRSATHRVSVYDPLAIEGVEVTTRYPDYLKLPDRKDVMVTGDVAAPIGSTVTIRVLTNRPLAEGALEWTGGAKQPLRLDPEQKTSAFASFEVQKDATYSFRVRDITDQRGGSPGPAEVKALKDRPPTVELTHPTETVELNPIGEIIALADATDDFGIEGVDFVYIRSAAESSREARVPMQFETSGPPAPGVPVVAKAHLSFRLEDLKPQAAPEESIAYYLECRDRKGQKSVSDIFFLTVVHYETWATWSTEPAEEGKEEVHSLEPYFRATWHLHTQKDALPPKDFNRQSEELAASMADPQTGQIYSFAKSHDPRKQENLRRVAEYVAQGHQALIGHDTGKAVDAFRIAMAEIAKIGVDDQYAHVVPQGAVPASNEPLKQLALIEAERLKAETMQTQIQAGAPEQKNDKDLARQAERVAAEARALEQKQAEIVREATEKAQAAAEPPKPEGGQPKEGEPKTENPQQANPEGGELAKKQDGVAKEARDAAEAAKQDPAAKTDPTLTEMARKLGRAVADMQQAASKMRTGRIEQALPEAERARQTLREVRDAASGMSQAKLEQALEEAEGRLERLVDRQQQARAGTETLDKAVPAGKPPDTAQQRDFRGVASEQVRLKSELGDVAKKIQDLRDWAEAGAKPDTAKHIDQANRDLTRGRADQKMANAVVELAAFRAAPAAGEQKKAEQTLQKTLEGIRAANDSLASDLESELRRAKNEAQRIEATLAKIDGKPEAGGQKDEAKGAEKPEAKGQKDEKGEAPPEPSPGPKEAGAAVQPSPRERAERGEQAAYEIKRLAKHLENRDLAEPKDTEALKQSSQNPQQLGQSLAQDDKKRGEVLRVVRRVRNKLEAEYEAKLQAKKLFAAQREECPPQYRELVNRYYEALSEARK